jgi:dual specificity tyrosine-phosphorylation-regulated kinase 1
VTVHLLATYKEINDVYYARKGGESEGTATTTSTTTSTTAHPPPPSSPSSSSSSVSSSTAPVVSYNDGFDDANGDYIVRSGEVIAGRYTVKSALGKGSFGQVVKAYDSRANEFVALKIIKNKGAFFKQARIEIRLLEHLYRHDPNDSACIVRFREAFEHRAHLVLAFELMSFNLYELLKNTGFHGVSLGLVRKFGYQILLALHFLSLPHVDTIHCDLKPENILLRNPKRSAIKVIDFGSSCHSHQRLYKYIQSRFYRAPEVVLELPYGHPIDMWSLGAILVEMHTGEPLFPGRTEADLLFRMVEVLGLPPDWMIDASPKSKKFFSFAPFSLGGAKYKLRAETNAKGQPFRKRGLVNILGVNSGGPGGRRSGEAGHGVEEYMQLYDLVRKSLAFDPASRITPAEALRHPFFAPVVQQFAPPPPVSPSLSHPQSGWPGGPADPTWTRHSPPSPSAGGGGGTDAMVE